MNGKRKFNIKSTEDSTDDELGGATLFKRFKSSTTNQINNQAVDNSSIKTSTNATENVENITNRGSSWDKPVDNEGSSTNAATKPKVGRNFKETFKFLKDPNLYKLPEKKEPTLPALPKNTNAIIVNSKQRGNPILKHVRNVPWEYGNIIADYEIGQTSCALFLSLRYHNLNPEYIHERLKLLGNRYRLRVLLVQVDLVNTKHTLKELAKICLLANMTLIVAWSPEEAGRYLETYKSYEFKPPDVLQEKIEADYVAKLQDILTTVKSVNKTDVITLMSTFGSFRNIVNASIDELALCPGFGPQKAQRLFRVFHETFKRSRTSQQSQLNKSFETSPTKSPAKSDLPKNSPAKSPAKSQLESSPLKSNTENKNTEENLNSTKKLDTCDSIHSNNSKTRIVKPAVLLSKLQKEFAPDDEEPNEPKIKKIEKVKKDKVIQKKEEEPQKKEEQLIVKTKKRGINTSSALSKSDAISLSGLSRTKKIKGTSNDQTKCNDLSNNVDIKDSKRQLTEKKISREEKTISKTVTIEKQSRKVDNLKAKIPVKDISTASQPERPKPVLTSNEPLNEIGKDNPPKVKPVAVIQPQKVTVASKPNVTAAHVSQTSKSNVKVNELSSNDNYFSQDASLAMTKSLGGTREISQEEYEDLLASDEEDGEDDIY